MTRALLIIVRHGEQFLHVLHDPGVLRCRFGVFPQASDLRRYFVRGVFLPLRQFFCTSACFKHSHFSMVLGALGCPSAATLARRFTFLAFFLFCNLHPFQFFRALFTDLVDELRSSAVGLFDSPPIFIPREPMPLVCRVFCPWPPPTWQKDVKKFSQRLGTTYFGRFHKGAVFQASTYSIPFSPRSVSWPGWLL